MGEGSIWGDMGATGVGNEGMYDYILFCACMRVSKKKKLQITKM